MTEDDVRELLKQQVTVAGGITAWINDRDMSVQYVSDVLKARRAPGPAILAALGLERREPTYEPREA